MKNDKYGHSKMLSGRSFDEAHGLVVEALKSEGFGVLTEIDVKATMKKKLDVEFRPYKILGACNPPLAYKALNAEPDIGLLLPCNVILQETDEGGTKVSVLSPKALFSLVDRPDMGELAEQVEGKLLKVLEALG